ncbi:hypothetical protein CA265_24270 [Sphingobacteriaceae bacterium GW460-11-11-14-LB5]|nr:hypothetical protein CA265_24270 [Sphingobacteriaceae bacterium GW460-11-11-14-LB5]
MKNQTTRSLSTKKVIEYFKAKGTNLSEEEAEKYIDLIYFFSKQAFNYIMPAKLAILWNLTASNQKKPGM